ncbi:PREDICTED: protein THEM6-like isoform X2 [Priapulus caudatus]|uniref:Protein THEM6 n=1 Tax=Priapulus caudatus TaxID=37621 RepID=A0ABM1E9Y7_PRICU|nr:PREDICTED: protein THEM6-like isoform X2 [Priapulus caudatus]
MKVVNVVVLAAFLLLDCYYFLRILFVVLHAKLVAQRKSPLDVFVTRGVCLTTDLDCSCHMNNARYLRELDFARTHMLFSSGLWKTLKHLKAGVVVGSNTIRYRREINLFQLYNIHTQIKYWDEKSLYIEQRYINTKDKFVFAIAIICFRVLRSTPREVLREHGHISIDSPEMPEDIALFVKYNEASSAMLRSETKSE